MKKKFSTLGKPLTKAEQSHLKDGGVCDGYNGPVVVTCEQFRALPPQYKVCVIVHPRCLD